MKIIIFMKEKIFIHCEQPSQIMIFEYDDDGLLLENGVHLHNEDPIENFNDVWQMGEAQLKKRLIDRRKELENKITKLDCELKKLKGDTNAPTV